ncbi:serpin family protein [Parasporobacterium paucivorans]|nr:serpin family protein [Parasporobacterium paucivorans]
MTLNLTACRPQPEAADLTEGLSARAVAGKAVDEEFIKNTSDFSVELFKRTVEDRENSLISPISVLLALAMTANGAEDETLAQMEKVLGGTIPQDDLNEYLYTYTQSLSDKEDASLHIADSIWFRDTQDLVVEPDFLQKNADYYGAAAYRAPFDESTIKDINSWVSKNTNGMIEEILDEINGSAVMFLINAIAFEAQWENVYHKEDIAEGDFTDIEGNTVSVDFMYSDESIYLEGADATGFVKRYAGGKYSFMALLPDEGVDINKYIESLSGEALQKILGGAQDSIVGAAVPKFSCEYTVKMNEALKNMGMEEAFNPDLAKFGRMGSSSFGNIYIQEVLHKTFITVDELGTKAGAVTKVEMGVTGTSEKKYVILDRPFIYAILDNDTNLPVFMGTVVSPEWE